MSKYARDAEPEPNPPGVKNDAGKEPYDLLPPLAEDAEVRVLAFGAKKYGPENWRLVEDKKRRYYAAAPRHLNQWWRSRGNERDEESGESHLAHARCCIGFLLELEENGELE